MKINKTVEQAIYVLVILALQKDHKAVKSNVLSEILAVSDSYLKKILMKLAHYNLVVASANKNGGYKLAKSIEDINLKDVYFALELHKDPIKFSNLAHQLFDEEDHVATSEQQVIKTFEQAFDKFYEELATLKLSSLLHEQAYKEGAIDWLTYKRKL